MESSRLPLLLTASISTRGMKGACFSDTEREAMYLAALKWYLENLPEDQPIVFAENSGWDLSAFADLVRVNSSSSSSSNLQTFEPFSRRVLEPAPYRHSHTRTFEPSNVKPQTSNVSRIEWISVDPAICDQSRGKGYNEILLMNEAVARSETIKKAGAFMKVTGRYPIFNLAHYLAAAEKFFAKGGAYYGDMKDHKLYDWLHTGWNGHAAYTVLFASTVEFYQAHLAGSYVDCNDYTDNWIECVWFRILKRLRTPTPHSSLPTPHTPLPTTNYHLPSTIYHLPSTNYQLPSLSLRFDREPICGGLQGSQLDAASFNQNNESMRARVQRFGGNMIRIFTPWFWF